MRITHKIPINISGIGQRITKLSWSPDGQYLAIGVEKSGVEIWDITRLALVSTIIEPELIATHCWSPNQSLFALQHRNGNVVIFDTDSFKQKISFDIGKKNFILSGSENPSLQWNTTGTKIACITSMESIAILDINLQRVQKEVSVPEVIRDMNRVFWIPGKDFLLFEDFDAYFCIYDLTTSQVIRESEEGSASSIACLSSNGQILYRGTMDGVIEIWNTKSALFDRYLPYDKLFTVDDHKLNKYYIDAMDLTTDNRYLATLGQDGVCRIWDSDKGMISDTDWLQDWYIDNNSDLAWRPGTYCLAIATRLENGKGFELWLVDPLLV